MWTTLYSCAESNRHVILLPVALSTAPLPSPRPLWHPYTSRSVFFLSLNTPPHCLVGYRCPAPPVTNFSALALPWLVGLILPPTLHPSHASHFKTYRPSLDSNEFELHPVLRIPAPLPHIGWPRGTETKLRNMRANRKESHIRSTEISVSWFATKPPWEGEEGVGGGGGGG